jgi:ATP-dependent Clp protease protease subunit
MKGKIMDPMPNVNASRRIYFTGNFNEDRSEKTIRSLLELEEKDPTKDILLYINSYGGSVDEYLAIHDTLKLLKCKVATICVGKAMSCGAMLLLSGCKGYRFITENSRVMLHEMSSITFGPVSTMANDLKEVKRLQELFKKLLLKYTNINATKYSSIMERDTYIDAKEAVKLGIVDKIVTDNLCLYKCLNI